MRLADHLDPKLIVTDLQPGDPEEILTRLVEPLARAGAVRDPDSVVEALLSRERVLSTGIGQGIAVPHAICPQLEATAVVIGRAPEGIEFHAIDGRPVHLFFVLLSPPERTSQHIKLLARIARLMRDASLIESLRQCETPGSLIETVETFERRHV